LLIPAAIPVEGVEEAPAPHAKQKKDNRQQFGDIKPASAQQGMDAISKWLFYS